MDEKLQRVIKESSFRQVPGRFYYVKVKERPATRHFAVMEDESEITVVTDRVNELKVAGQNQTPYALFALNVSVPFYAIGFLAAVTSAIAAQDMNVMVVDTYSKGYILVAFEKARVARAVLLELGFREV